MRTTARKRVLDFVAAHPETSASQMARGLGMSAPAVRHHLAILRSDGRIEASAGFPGQRRGRPETRYRVSEQLLGNNLAMLSDSLLRAWSGQAGTELMDALAQGLRDQLGTVDASVAAANRLSALVSRLNLFHYEAHWEAGATGPRLIFGHCPYAAVIEKHPELCQMDARAVSEIMRSETRQIAKMTAGGLSESKCVFSLG